jgi:membrane associated rhomboid family serine protease
MPLEQYRPSRLNLMPTITKNIIIINVIMFITTVVFERMGINLVDILGLHYFESEKFHIWQFITYMFMHGGSSAHPLQHVCRVDVRGCR